jgi:CHAD domain-containing protein
MMPPPQRGGAEAAIARPSPETRLDGGMAMIFRASLARWLAAIPAASRRHNVEGIHQLRVALRRTRSLFSLLSEFIPAPQRKTFETEIKWLVAALAPVRDLDVLHNDLVVPLQNKKAIKNLDVLIDAIHAQRAKAQHRAQRALVSIRHRKLVDSLATWIEQHGWRGGRSRRAPLAQPTGRAARKFLNKRLRKILKDGRRIKKLDPEDLHQLRIAMKKVRYGISFFKTALPPRAKKLSKILAALQDSLGHLNDADVASGLIKRLAKNAADAETRDKVKAAGKQLVAHTKKTAADVWSDITPQWKALKKFGSV